MGLVTLDGNRYIIKGRVKTGVLPTRILDAVPESGQPNTDNLLNHKREVWSPPWGVGFQRQHRRGFIWDEENVNSLFPNLLTLGPLKNTTTLPAGTIQYNRFQEARGEVFAMAQDKFTKVASTTLTKMYFHSASDDRSLPAFPAAPTGRTTTGYSTTAVAHMNSTIGNGQTSTTVTHSAAPTYGFLRRFAGPSLGAQTIAAQNWTLNIARESTATTAPVWLLRLYAFRPSSGTVVGYIVGGAADPTEYTASSLNTSANTEQSFQNTVFSGSAVTVQEGDVLICEIYSGTAAIAPVTCIFYYDGTTETLTDNTTVSNHASFISSANALTISGARPAKVAGKLAVFDNPSTWTDTTVDTDTNVNGVQALVETKFRAVALSQYPFDHVGGEDGRILAVSTDNAVWSVVGPNVQNNFFYIDMTLVAGTLNLLYTDDHTFPTRWFRATIADIDSTSAPTIATTVASRELPRGIISYPNSAGTESAWVSAADGLYLGSDRIVKFLNPTSTFTGKLSRGMVNGLDSLVWSDGPNVYAGFWTEALVFAVVNLGPQSVGDGLLTAKQGDVTDLYVSNERPWVFAAVGGGDSSHNGHVMVLDSVDRKWHRPYYNSTANRRVRAIFVSREDDGTNRLHIMEDNGVAGDVSGFFFSSILDNPTQVTSYTYAASGLFRTSRFGGHSEVLLNGFFTISAIGDDFTADESLSVAVATNGGALGAGQTISARGTHVSVDGAGAVGTEAYDLDFQVTLARLAGTNTNSPKVRALSLSYEPNPLTRASLKPRWWRFTISGNPADYEGARVSVRPELVLTRLETTIARSVLVPFLYNTGRKNAVSVNVRVEPYTWEETAAEGGDLEEASNLGDVVVEVRQVI